MKPKRHVHIEASPRPCEGHVEEPAFLFQPAASDSAISEVVAVRRMDHVDGIPFKTFRAMNRRNHHVVLVDNGWACHVGGSAWRLQGMFGGDL